MSFKEAWRGVFNKAVPNFLLRLFVMFVGLTCTAFAIALSRATELGTSTVSCVPAVLSYLTPFTIGSWLLALNLAFIGMQALMLRRYFKPAQLLSVPFMVVFSAMIDAFVPLCELIPMDGYAARMTYTLLSCVVMALGAWMQAKCALIMVPGDGFAFAVSVVSKSRYSTCKMALDLSLTAIAVALSLLTLGGLYGVREGTVIAAFLVGPLIRVWGRLLAPFRWLVPVSGHIRFMPDRAA